jgi:hypothetical protein
MSPIRARIREPESKVQGARRSTICLLWTREPESKEEHDLLWTRESESKGESDLLWTRGSESKGGSDLLWTGESDRVRVQGRARSGKAFSWTGFIRPGFVWSVAEQGVGRGIGAPQSLQAVPTPAETC